MASSAARTAAWVVRSTAAAKPQVPFSTTRTARPSSSASISVSRCPSDSPISWPRMRSAAEIGVLRAELPGALQRGRGQLAQRQAGELRIDPVPAARFPAAGPRAC